MSKQSRDSVYCQYCGEQMLYVYDKRLRDTCWECGGEVKYCRPVEVKESRGL